MYRLVTIEICIGWLPQGFLYSLVTIMYNMVTIGICIPFSLLIFVQFSIHWVLYTFFSSVYRLVLGSIPSIQHAAGANAFPKLPQNWGAPSYKNLLKFILCNKNASQKLQRAPSSQIMSLTTLGEIIITEFSS